MSEWRQRQFQSQLYRMVQRTEGLGAMMGLFPKEVIEDDIIVKVMRDAFVLYSEFDERVQKLLLRAKHLHDEERYGT